MTDESKDYRLPKRIHSLNSEKIDEMEKLRTGEYKDKKNLEDFIGLPIKIVKTPDFIPHL